MTSNQTIWLRVKETSASITIFNAFFAGLMLKLGRQLKNSKNTTITIYTWIFTRKAISFKLSTKSVNMTQTQDNDYSAGNQPISGVRHPE